MPSGSAFVFGPHVCGSPAGFELEWLVTDGVGGFATGTAAGLRTRRYHALLVVPDGDGGRRVALAALDPTLTLPSGATVRLAVHEWASGAVDPTGHHFLERFELIDGLPRWRWRVGEVLLEREVAMTHGRSAVAVTHRLLAGPPVKLSLTALCTWRDADAERGASGPRPKVTAAAGGVVIDRAYRLAGKGWKTRGDWYLGAYARAEAERGLNPIEDLWAAGSFSVTLKPDTRPDARSDTGASSGGTDVHEVLAWAGELDQPPPPARVVIADAHKRARKVVRAAKPADDTAATLALAADSFIVTPAGSHPTVVAGYPWFGASLRDTMTAYEGLFLHTGRAKEGRKVLAGHAAALRAEVPLDDADGPLWFVHALERHVAATGDHDLAAKLLPAVETVISTYTMKNNGGVGLDPADGLLGIEADEVGLTWMNARRQGRPVTPRDGKPVELNALWVNALGAAVALHEAVGGKADTSHLTAARDAARLQFAKRFPAPGKWLYDLVDVRPAPYPLGGGSLHDDPVLRPNQLLAYSLPFAPLDGGDHRAVQAVATHLLTPLGLRTLAVREFGYYGAHRGGVEQRDSAYHQGTVWPWLIGPFVGASRAAGLPLHGLLGGLEAHLGEAGLGSVSETADGDPPHRPSGAPFSARSVGELIRARSLAREVSSQGIGDALR
jgi:predicted glycogen debranching enzyme